MAVRARRSCKDAHPRRSRRNATTRPPRDPRPIRRSWCRPRSRRFSTRPRSREQRRKREERARHVATGRRDEPRPERARAVQLGQAVDRLARRARSRAGARTKARSCVGLLEPERRRQIDHHGPRRSNASAARRARLVRQPQKTTSQRSRSSRRTRGIERLEHAIAEPGDPRREGSACSSFCPARSRAAT